MRVEKVRVTNETRRFSSTPFSPPFIGEVMGGEAFIISIGGA
jgi:hypothetical protein